MNLDRVGNIESLEQKLEQLKNKVVPNETGYWHKLSVYCQNMSADQLKFVNSNKNVQASYKKMIDAFNLFLFEKMKEEFVTLSDAKPLCEDYINSILKASEEYADILSSTQRENEELKKRVMELEKKQNGCNSKRT